MKKIEAIFIDRDGTIGGDDTVHYPGEFDLFPYTSTEINRLKRDGIRIFSFTNQPGISRGLAKEKDFEEELLAFGFDDVYMCPHDYNEGCSCRKPNTGMLIEAQKDYELCLENGAKIGDRWSDMVAASRVGSINILVRTGAGESSLSEHYDKLQDVKIDYIANNLLDAID
ncbi:histidinol-phosphate phosphatase family domain-containing protein/HAD-superfamily hydrolase, subfamily IIIA [Thalassobacillus cyri]|uniref:D,D-heptose 1,7-bisphosphate phosphatase n=1 Tax=Thalassobacillus cyri TaxID=571932 RepID=A0A1H4G740_9BACI|nr:HAD-IIIA family hydrolase [Thalassobacillus cyri]SEB05409.1 histidinol-phosphate phosphatase family domain-containing protein/HAD-superfamily hydrolase, subfamily IIIA [Thalassobacillus cyri]